jgi:hypothetical protein
MNKDLYKDLLKSVSKWLMKNLSSILIFTFIIILAVLIDIYGTDISTNTVNVIVAVAAGASTFFLYLTYKESKKSNDLIIYKSVFDELNNKVTEKILKANAQVFSNENSKYILETINSDNISVEFVTYSLFIFDIFDVITFIKTKTKYADYIKLLDNKESAVIPSKYISFTELNKQSLLINIIHNGIFLIIINYIEIYFIYNSIHTSSLHKSQKSLLINKLNSITDNELYYLIKAILNEPVSGDEDIQELYECCNELKQFVFFDLGVPNKIIKSDSNFDYISPAFDYTKIKAQYY